MRPRVLGNGRGTLCTPATFESGSGAESIVVLAEGKPGRMRLSVAGIRYDLRCRPSKRCPGGNAGAE